MNHIIKTLALLTFSFSLTANAAEKFIELEDNSKILGTWHMTGESPKLSIKPTKVSNKWTFSKDGTMSSVSSDRRFSGFTGGNAIKVKYSIEDGMIRKQFQPGREKYEFCKVTKMEGSEMILHCKFNYFFFTKVK